jgi:hypothetical protein
MSSSQLSSRRLALLSGFALLGVIGAASVCSAESPWRRRVTTAPPPPYRVELEGLDGASLPTFRHGGTSYVLGEPGTRYNVRVSNPTAERVEVVVTVDGRDAVSGQPGDYVSQRGYLIEPWGTLLVEGFRRSLDEVAAFRFTDRSRSYSALRGTPQNVGVIGVAVFPEKPRAKAPIWRPRRPYSYDDHYVPEPSAEADRERGGRAGRAAPAPAPAPAPAAAPKAATSPRAAASPARPSDAYREEREERYDDGSPKRHGGAARGPSNIGTQFGESHDSSVVEVAFERRSPTHPAALLSLRYDDFEGLEARGIDLSSVGYAYRHDNEPEPFPYSRFAEPPR